MNERTYAATRKRAAKLSINADLLYRAKGLGINLSQTLEERLIELVKKAEARDWLSCHRRAINTYNERIEREGGWSDGLRGF